MKIRLSIITLCGLLFILAGSPKISNSAPSLLLPSPTPAQPFPALEKITPENAHKLELVGTLGRGSIEDLYWSPDGQWIAAQTAQGTWLYQADAIGTVEPILIEGRITFSPDSKLIATWSFDFEIAYAWRWQDSNVAETLKKPVDTTIRLLEADTLQSTAQLEGAPFMITSTAFSADVKELASIGIDGTILLWDVQTGQQKAIVIEGETERRFELVAFGPDNTIVTTYNKLGEIERHKTNTGITLVMLPNCVDWGAINTIMFSDDQSVVVCETEHAGLKAWDFKTGNELANLNCLHDGGCDFNPRTKRLAHSSQYLNADVQQIVSGGTLPLPLNGLHEDYVMDMAFSPDGDTIATAGDDNIIKIWDLITGDEKFSIPNKETIANLIFSPDGDTLVSWTTGGFALWDMKNRQQTASNYDHFDHADRLEFSANGRLLTMISETGNRSYVRAWDVNSGELKAFLGAYWAAYGPQVDVTASPDGRFLGISGNAVEKWQDTNSNSSYFIWDIQEQKMVQEYDWEGYHNTLKLFSVDSTFAIASVDTQILFLDVATGKISLRLDGHTSTIYAIALNADGTLLASSDAETVRLWSVGTGQQVAVFPNALGESYQMRFSANSEELLLLAYRDVVIWNIASGEAFFPSLPKNLLAGLWGDSKWMDFSPDLSIAVGSLREENSVFARFAVWELHTSRVLFGSRNGSLSAAFSSDGMLIAAADAKAIRLYSIPR
jgi:WD40 repeat protein